MTGRFRWVRHTAAAALTAAVAACGTNPPPAKSIEISDDNVFQPVLRGAFSLSSLRGPASDPQTGHAIEVGGTRAKGGSEQSLRGVDYVSLGSTRINGPATLSSEFELRQLEIAYRFRGIDPGSGIGIDLLAGPAVYELDVAVRSGGLAASETLTSVGPQLGIGALWRIRRGTSVHLRGSYFYSADDAGVTRATRIDAYLSQALARNIALRGGYAWWNADSDRGGATSPVNVEFSGPVLGLEVLF